MKLTEESARAVQKLPLVKNSTTDFLHATTRAPNGQFAKSLQFVAKPGAMLANPAVLAGLGGIMAQCAMQQTMEEITDYLAQIDAKVDEILRAQEDAVLADMLGVELILDESVPYPERLAPMIEEACAGKGPEGLLFGDGVNHMRNSGANGWFANAVRRAQEIDPSIPRVTPHDLRHTATSLTISSGANVKAVQRMLGHASAAMTLDMYADLFDDDLDAVAESLNAQIPLIALPTGPQTRYTRPHTEHFAQFRNEANASRIARFSRSGTLDGAASRPLTQPRSCLIAFSNAGKSPKLVRLRETKAWSAVEIFGAPGGIRTPDPLLRTEWLFH